MKFLMGHRVEGAITGLVMSFLCSERSTEKRIPILDALPVVLLSVPNSCVVSGYHHVMLMTIT